MVRDFLADATRTAHKKNLMNNKTGLAAPADTYPKKRLDIAEIGWRKVRVREVIDVHSPTTKVGRVPVGAEVPLLERAKKARARVNDIVPLRPAGHLLRKFNNNKAKVKLAKAINLSARTSRKAPASAAANASSFTYLYLL